MGYLSKYAVPFSGRKISTTDNVIRKVIKGGIGYLKIEVPLNPSIDNCIGFKVKIKSEDSGKLIFDGYISGSSSDGYKWIHATCSDISDGEVLNNPVLFCYKYIDGDSEKSAIKSILLGGNDTNWGSLLSIDIEFIQATLSTNPDGNEGVVRTSSINEYSSSQSSNSLIDGWKFSVGQITDEIISMSVNKVPKDPSSSIILDGVISGVAKTDESGNIVITTEFTGGSINLYNSISKEYGKIIADGSEIVGLENNESLKGMTFPSTGFKDPILIKSDPSSDVSLNLTIMNSGETITPRVNIEKFNLGEWSNENTKKFSVKVSNNLGTSDEVNLEYGGLGLINSGKDSDLYIGLGSSNLLVGSVKFCDNKSEFDSIKKVDGRLVVYDGRLYACRNGSYEVLKFSDKISLDEVKNGYFYERINADAQLGGEVIRLKYDDGILLANDIHSHIEDSSHHISMSDRNKWDNKLDKSDTYTRDEVNNLIKNLSSSDHYHSYHNPINDILPGDHDFSTHNYPYGHRVLVKEYLESKPYIRIAGAPNEWIGIEEFNLGDKVVAAFDNYQEFINMNNKVIEIDPSGAKDTSVIVKDGDDIILVI